MSTTRAPRQGPPRVREDCTPMPSGEAHEKTSPPLPDVEAMAANSARLMEELGKATAAALKPVEEGRVKPGVSDEVSDMVKTLGQVAEHWAMDPQRVIIAQTSLTKGFMDLWTGSMRRLQGENVPA